MGRLEPTMPHYMPLASRVPQHSPTTLQRASGDMYQIEECYIDSAPRKASEALRQMEEADIARCNQGNLHSAVVLPGFTPDAEHWGHSPIKYHGPKPPPDGNLIGE